MTDSSFFDPSSAPQPEAFAIVAMGANREIGFRGDMPWHLSEDLRHFKQLTLGHPVIMGRATWLSLPRRPLPGRRNIVLSRSADFSPEGAEKASSIPEALALCHGGPTPFILGGGSVYARALPFLSRIFVTRIDAAFPDADTFFPPLDPSDWRLSESEGPFSSVSGLSFSFETYESRNNK